MFHNSNSASGTRSFNVRNAVGPIVSIAVLKNMFHLRQSSKPHNGSKRNILMRVTMLAQRTTTTINYDKHSRT